MHQPGPVLGADQIVSTVRRFVALLAEAGVVSWAQGVGRAHVHLDASGLGSALEAIIAVARPHNIMVEPWVEAEQ
ncbi:MAG: hypothetical protein GY724_08420 [Actinomycetia bacterium]|nr:hypothetical protein [Actinomycetes bacterium]MCP5031499.1 hypothetical protein [Actinomycetes bacterium]